MEALGAQSVRGASRGQVFLCVLSCCSIRTWSKVQHIVGVYEMPGEVMKGNASRFGCPSGPLS